MCRWPGGPRGSSAPRSGTCAGSLAVELLCAGRALDLRAPNGPAGGTGAALAALRTRVPGPGPDRWLSPELAAADACIESGELLCAVESVLGRLE